MSISGSGTGTPGGIPEFSLLSDQTASASVLRAAMGIVKNLDTISFTDVDKKALWKYDTSSSKPTLHPLEHVRVEVSPSRIDDSWKQMLQDLINDLPDDVKTAYERNLLLPPEQKNTALIALGRLLEGTAKTLNWIKNSAAALDPQNPAAGPESEMEARKTFNNALSGRILSGIMANSHMTFQTIRNELLKIGNNDPRFDELAGILNQVGTGYYTILNLNGNSAEEG